MPTSKAESVQARVLSNSTPPEKVSHEPSEISETCRSEEPSLRYRMTTTVRRVRHPREALRVPPGNGPRTARADAALLLLFLGAMVPLWFLTTQLARGTAA